MTEREWRDRFGRNLSILLYETGMTQKDLSEVSGVSESDISRYINGTQTPTATKLVNLSYALNCDYDELIDFGERVIR